MGIYQSTMAVKNASSLALEAKPTAESPTSPIKEDRGRLSERDGKSANRKQRQKATYLTGFELVQYECRKHKRAYDRCYNKWYGSTFAAGAIDKDSREKCDDFFEAYQHCILLGMKRDREIRGLGKAKEGSAIAEFEQELDEE